MTEKERLQTLEIIEQLEDSLNFLVYSLGNNHKEVLDCRHQIINLRTKIYKSYST